MAVGLVRRKRIIASVFVVCLITALFLYTTGVREARDDVELKKARETSDNVAKRNDLSKEKSKGKITTPMPTKMYKVVIIDDEETEGTVPRQEVKNDEQQPDETKGKLRETKGVEADNDIGTRTTVKDEKRAESTTTEERVASNEEITNRGSENKENVAGEENRKTMRRNEGEKEANEKLRNVIETENLESHVKDYLKRREDNRLEPSKITKSLSVTQSISVNAGYARPTTMEKLNKSQSIKGKFVLQSTTHKSNPVDVGRGSSLPRSVGVDSNNIGSTAGADVPTPARSDAKITKSNWVNKTIEMANPRLKKLRQPTTEASGNKPTLRKSTSPPKTTMNPKQEPLACKIPTLDPFHPHVSRLQNDVGTDLRRICRRMHPYTPAFKVVNNKLVLKDGVNANSIVKDSIKLQEIKRAGDSDFRYRSSRNPFDGTSSLYESQDIGQSDFFRVDYKIEGRQASDLYARVSPKLDVLQRQTELAKEFQEKGLPLNVLIIGFDSISRANFVRKLPRVKSFLETELNTYFMDGMSIVGDATTPILAAMLTGKDETVLPEGRKSFGGRHIDNWPWIMKDYERQGYMTLFAEDDPGVSAFNLRLHGFSKSPTHHYMRPFWLSLESEHERDEPGRCSKSESMVNHTLKYVKSFFDTYPSARKYAFAFHSYLAHAHPNHLSLAEEDLMWFLKSFVDKGYLKDAMLIIMGDHGSRNSEYRNTMQGKLEERLPWFSISLPSTFHRRFPDLVANLGNNQVIIASSFDVHATLRHILTYPSLPKGEQTQSLFTKLPRNRTCKDAGIAEHWCPCLQWKPTDVNSKEVQNIARSAVKLINEKLTKEPHLEKSCHELSLENVIDAVGLKPNKKVQTFYSTDQDGDRTVNFAERSRDLLRFQVIFTTRPNQAKYEVTAHISPRSNKVTVNPEISRLNRYNDQPACIAKQYPYARKFCYCRGR